jgi:PPM family protein phosphatase
MEKKTIPVPVRRRLRPGEKDNVSFAVGFQTHVGRVREINEDSYAVFRRQELADELDALLVIADGMGGGNGGDVASRIVAETVPETVQEFLFEHSGSAGRLNIERILSDAIERANARIWMRQAERQELRGMGTTCVVAALKDDTLTISHAGDSRAYLLRDGQLRQITDDHSEVWQQVLAGRLTREEAARSKFRNRILKAVGLGQSGVEPDVENVPLQEGDTVLLCTDGLNTEISDTEIARILASTTAPQEACNQLVDAALRSGGSDNITVVVLRYGKFTPLTSTTVAHATRPALLEDVEEETTDPNPSWRGNSRQERAASRPPVAVFQDDGDTDDTDEDEAPRPSRRHRNEEADEDPRRYAARETSQGGSNLANVLIGILFLLCIAEGIALFIASANRKVVMPRPPTEAELKLLKNPDIEWMKNREFNYGNVKELYKKEIRPDFLIVEPLDSVIVMTPQGKLLRITDDGKPHPVPGPTVPLPKNMKPPGGASVTFDAAGNRYQSDPKGIGIQKYEAGGTRKSQDITEGAVFRPTAIGIHREGHIYVIDDGKLKRLEAFEGKKIVPGETP